MPTLENRIAALEKSIGTTDSETHPGESFEYFQNAGIDVPEPIRGESTAAWLRRFSDAQLTEVKVWLEAEVAHGATTIEAPKLSQKGGIQTKTGEQIGEQNAFLITKT